MQSQIEIKEINNKKDKAADKRCINKRNRSLTFSISGHPDSRIVKGVAENQYQQQSNIHSNHHKQQQQQQLQLQKATWLWCTKI